MFKITLMPKLADEELSISKSGSSLIVNGVNLDFSDMPEGGDYPPEAIDHPLVRHGASKRGGVINITIRMPYTNPEPPHSVAFPKPIIVDVNGVVELPEGRFVDGDQ